jgi:ribonuclease-3
MKKNDLRKFEGKIGISFKNPDLLKNVFIHRSFLNENRRKKLVSNERLEFLGDAVLELVVTEYLYKNYPNPEGDLTNFRSALVRGEMLSRVADELEMGDLMMMSKGEEKNQTRSKRLILANAFEALVGAIYLDLGYDQAKRFIGRFLLPRFRGILEGGLFRDARSEFQELMQEKKSATPEYRVLMESGPDHDKRFEVGVYVGRKLYGKGSGSSKQKACQQAAARALKKINL